MQGKDPCLVEPLSRWSCASDVWLLQSNVLLAVLGRWEEKSDEQIDVSPFHCCSLDNLATLWPSPVRQNFL